MADQQFVARILKRWSDKDLNALTYALNEYVEWKNCESSLVDRKRFEHFHSASFVFVLKIFDEKLNGKGELHERLDEERVQLADTIAKLREFARTNRRIGVPASENGATLD